MTLKTRLARLEGTNTRPSRLMPISHDSSGRPDVMTVIGGGTFYRKDFASQAEFQAAIDAADKRAWEADPHNPDPVASLFAHVAKHGKRIGQRSA